MKRLAPAASLWLERSARSFAAQEPQKRKLCRAELAFCRPAIVMSSGEQPYLETSKRIQKHGLLSTDALASA